MLSTRFLVVLSVGLFIAATVSASPTFDGNIDASDSYFVVLDDVDVTPPDDPNDPNIQDDLDIKSVGFDLDNDYLWLGLGVCDGPVATDGGLTSLMGMTVFYTRFETGSGSDSLVVVLDAGAIAGVTLNGVPLTSGTDYVALLGSHDPNGGLEIKIDKDLLPAVFTFHGQLDDTGFANDDQITGIVDVPEPITLTLIALGMPLVMLRRRR